MTACTEYSLQGKEGINSPPDGDSENIDPDDPTNEEDPEDDTFGDPNTEGQPPVAVCSVNPEIIAPLIDSADFMGYESYDPEGGALIYEWELIEIPEGSTASFGWADTDTVYGFIADLAGTYTGQLTVTDDEGLTDTCQASLEAVPYQNLWVEMYWEYPDDDMDLHLIAPNKDWNSFKETEYDCYYSNCTSNAWTTLDWGVSGVSTDDPRLDLDDISATGPENINIDQPESGGMYTVLVHDYPYTGTYAGANNVTINIYLDGSLAWSDTRPISGEDTYTVFAKIDWANSQIIPQ